MLDRRRPFGEVMGSGAAGARWYQDGHYFSPDGRYLFSNPDAPAPKGETKQTMEQAEATYAMEQAAQERGEGPPTSASTTVKVAAAKTKASKPAPPGPLVEAQASTVTLPEGATREQKLVQLNHFQLVALINAAGGKPETGKGSKAKNIAWLLANTQ